MPITTVQRAKVRLSHVLRKHYENAFAKKIKINFSSQGGMLLCAFYTDTIIFCISSLICFSVLL